MQKRAGIAPRLPGWNSRFAISDRNHATLLRALDDWICVLLHGDAAVGVHLDVQALDHSHIRSWPLRDQLKLDVGPKIRGGHRRKAAIWIHLQVIVLRIFAHILDAS